MAAAGCSSPSGQATPPIVTTTTGSPSYISTTIPNTKVGAQLAWFLAAVSAAPVSSQEIDAHFPTNISDELSSATFNAALEEFSPASGASLVGLLSEGPTSLVAIARFGTGNWKVTVAVDGDGLIDRLLLTPSPERKSWAEFDRELRALAPHVSFLVALMHPRQAEASRQLRLSARN
jgi:hypothetical protein